MRHQDLIWAGADSEAKGYALLDSGQGSKLERLAGRLVERPCVQAIWSRRLPAKEWQAAASVCTRSKDGGGSWSHKGSANGLQFRWPGSGDALRIDLRLTDFGHCGVFFEQVPLWQLMQERLQPGGRCCNLFGYTGCASLAAAAVGAQVFHVDSSKGVINWGKANQQASGIKAERIKWIHDDVRSFLQLSIKRGFTYDLVYVDPPAWGHGTGKRKWLFEQEIAELIRDCVAILAPGGRLLVSHHTPGVQLAAMVNVLADCGAVPQQVGELGIRHQGDARVLPAGMYCLYDHG